jgi:hypothetical protein
MLSLGGVPLNLLTAEASAAIAAGIDVRAIRPWLRRAWPGPGELPLGLPIQYYEQIPVELGKFYWPSGASRWAFGHFFASTNQANAINENQLKGNKVSLNPVALKMDSPGLRAQENISTLVYVLPPYPLRAVPPIDGESVNGAYLLTVVDVRYYWWNYSVPDLSITTGTTWDSLFRKVEKVLGITIKNHSYQAAFVNPHKSLNCIYGPIPPFLDTVAFNLGQRIVRALDGTVTSQRHETSSAIRHANDILNPDRTLRAGGDLFQDVL